MVAGLEQARAVLDHERRATAPDDSESSAEDSPPRAATVAEGLVHLADAALTAMATARPEAAHRGRSRLVVLVDPLAGWARLADGELLPSSSLRALQTPAVRLRPLVGGDLTHHDLGRAQRLPSLGLRELLGTVDGERCRFPGCTRHRKLHAHHVQFWSQDGATDLANPLLLCPRHHTLVHAQGFRLQLHTDRSLSVTAAEGAPVLHHPARPWRPAEELDPGGRITAHTLPPTVTGDGLDLGYAVSVILQQAA
ncbi:MAG: HNH endonuclease [Actinomycetota bacterium]|nr:HNH endonuclease [Actinomycetota bacterium]